MVEKPHPKLPKQRDCRSLCCSCLYLRHARRDTSWKRRRFNLPMRYICLHEWTKWWDSNLMESEWYWKCHGFVACIHVSSLSSCWNTRETDGIDSGFQKKKEIFKWIKRSQSSHYQNLSEFKWNFGNNRIIHHTIPWRLMSRCPMFKLLFSSHRWIVHILHSQRHVSWIGHAVLVPLVNKKISGY